METDKAVTGKERDTRKCSGLDFNGIEMFKYPRMGTDCSYAEEIRQQI